MPDLASCFAGLVRHHVATPACPLPERTAGITWIFAANGVFKRGVNDQLDLLVQTKAWPPGDPGRAGAGIPGLVALMPYARWRCWPDRLPGSLLGPLLDNARRAADGGLIARPIEKHYCYVWRNSSVKLVAPPQQGTAGHITYAPAAGVTLCDIHSHHAMPAFFSATDDADDTGLSVSAVVGRIFDRPELLIRLNVYGDRQQVGATAVFDHTGPFIAKEWRDANTPD